MRLDIYTAEKLGVSRTRASNIVKMGGVTVNGAVCTKTGAEIAPSDNIFISDTVKYASLGGVKLENAFRTFGVSPSGKECLDVGAANGGFTQCMLVNGAKSVASVDLNLAFPPEVAEDERVTLYDGVNAKNLAEIFPPERFDLISVDLSFISLCPLFPLFYNLLRKGGSLISLFKPQFEVGRAFLPKSGVVHDKKAMEKAFRQTVESAKLAGFSFVGACDVPEYFADKNKEKTILFVK